MKIKSSFWMYKFIGTVISGFSFSEVQEAINLFNMKNLVTKNLNPLVINIQPMTKDKYEVSTFENECKKGNATKNELYEGEEAEMFSKLLVLMKKLINAQAYHMQPFTLVQLHKYKMKQFNRKNLLFSQKYQKHLVIFSRNTQGETYCWSF